MNSTRQLRVGLMAIAFLLAACGQQEDGKTAQYSNINTTETTPDDSARILMERVDHFYKNVIHDSLASLAPEAMAYNREHGQWKEYYTTWCLLVNDLVWNGQMDRGFEEARRMHDDAIKRNNSFGLSEAYTAMGIAFHFQNNNKESVSCYQQALSHYPEDADQSVKLNIYSYYCQVLVDMKDFKTAVSVIDEWYDFLMRLTGGDMENEEFAHWYFRFHRESYKVAFAQRDFRRAARELDDMQRQLDKEEDREVYEAQVAGLRTQLAMALHDYPKAMEWSNREIELSKLQDFNTYLNALRHRSDVLQKLGHYEEALKAFRSYDEQKDSLIKSTTRQELNELTKRFQLDELKVQQQRTKLEHERTRLRLILLVGVVIIGAFVFLTLYRMRAQRRLQAAHRLLEITNQKLEESNEKLEEINRKLEETNEKLEESNEELQRSNEQLRVANERAKESSKMKSNFIQQISHEIRTPLNILSGFTQIVTTPGLVLGEEEKATISRQITENTDRITGLVNKMLELSDANSQVVLDRNDYVPVIQVAMQAVEGSGIAQSSHLDFDIRLGEGVEEAMMNTHLRQATRALTLLLDNARKFTRKPEAAGAGSLSEEKAKAWLGIDLESGDDGSPVSVSFSVEDTGIGVPPEESERIFDEFVQLDEYYDGTGIGLAVARSIARRLGGNITLDTTYSPGARFVMTLPL